MSLRVIVVRVANAQGVSERNPDHEARLALTKPGKYGEPDVILRTPWTSAATISRSMCG